MAHTYLLFDFGTDEEKAQLARHKLEGWKQAFRLDKKLQYKLERAEEDAQPAAEQAQKSAEAPKAEKPKAKGKTTTSSSSGGGTGGRSAGAQAFLSLLDPSFLKAGGVDPGKVAGPSGVILVDSKSLSARNCAGCARALTGEGIQAVGRSWHSHCFNCASCKKNLASAKFISKGEKAFCDGVCANKAVCPVCRSYINTSVDHVTALSQKWHSKCFSCRSCSKLLSGTDFHHGEEPDWPYCSSCGT